MARASVDTEPLDGAELLILESLADGAKHGYLLTTDIAARHGRRLGPGTLYVALARLETRGLIRALDSADRRRPYEMTDEGVRRLTERLHELAGFSAAGLDRLQGRHA
jgi:DNA-binding PadR family transcriptional regulator